MHLTVQTKVFGPDQNLFMVDEKAQAVNCVLVPLQLLQGFTLHPHVGLLAASDEDVGDKYLLHCQNISVRERTISSSRDCQNHVRVMMDDVPESA